jgi:hypothetical protein
MNKTDLFMMGMKELDKQSTKTLLVDAFANADDYHRNMMLKYLLGLAPKTNVIFKKEFDSNPR